MSATRPLDARGARSRAGLAIGAVGVLLALWAGYHWLQLRSAARPRVPAPLATPPGITLQQRTRLDRSHPAAPEPVYADEHGMTLYLRRSERGAAPAECSGECAETWRPALAPSGATAARDWSLIARPDRTQQWAYRGAPLYRFGKDAAIGDALGEGADGGAWHAAVFDLAAGMATPGDVSVKEINDAGGVGLVDATGLTLYAYGGDGTYSEPRCEPGGDCAHHWLPLAAPAVASRVGDFSVVARADGIAQWAYRDLPLYTFGEDQKAGDANGAGIDPRFDVALIARYFMPAGAAIRRNTGLGKILTTSAAATLYQRDRVDPNESPDPRGRSPAALGRAYGTASCEADCARQRPPFVAPADALPSGYWEILTRLDGTRQWAYKGFALYTYAPEGPGETRGNEVYELARVGDDAAAAFAATGSRAANVKTAAVDPTLPFGASVAGVGVSALYWHVVVP